jgi:hypothetical protein
MAQGTPEGFPRPEAEARLLKESIDLLRGEVAAGRKSSLDWPLLRIVRRIRTDQLHSTGSLEVYGLNEGRVLSC